MWSNPLMAAETADAVRRFPYSSHSGYYEILVGVGWVGMALLGLFLAVTLYRAFAWAWRASDMLSVWPFAIIAFESVFTGSAATATPPTDIANSEATKVIISLFIYSSPIHMCEKSRMRMRQRCPVG